MTIHGDLGEVELTIAHDDDTDTGTLHVIREDGDWKVCER